MTGSLLPFLYYFFAIPPDLSSDRRPSLVQPHIRGLTPGHAINTPLLPATVAATQILTALEFYCSALPLARAFSTNRVTKLLNFCPY